MVGIKTGPTIMEDSTEIRQKPKLHLPCHPAITPPCVYPKESQWTESSLHSLITAAPFTTAKTWIQPGCLPTDNSIKKYIMEYYLAIKKNKIQMFEAKWIQLEIIMLTEISQKDKYHIFSDLWYLTYSECKIYIMPLGL